MTRKILFRENKKMAATNFPGTGRVLTDIDDDGDIRLIDFVKEFDIYPIAWDKLSSNPNITYQDVKEDLASDKPHRWHWGELSKNPNITYQDVMDDLASEDTQHPPARRNRL